MNINKATNRERKIERRKSGHREDGRSVFLIQEEQRKRREEIKKSRIRKQQQSEEE